MSKAITTGCIFTTCRIIAVHRISKVAHQVGSVSFQRLTVSATVGTAASFVIATHANIFLGTLSSFAPHVMVPRVILRTSSTVNLEMSVWAGHVVAKGFTALAHIVWSVRTGRSNASSIIDHETSARGGAAGISTQFTRQAARSKVSSIRIRACGSLTVQVRDSSLSVWNVCGGWAER
jgi:hypothetical protein